VNQKKIYEQIYGQGGGFLSKYKAFCVGHQGWLRFIYFETVTLLFRNIPGSLGLALRALFYRPLFRKIGKGVIFGTNIVLRNPGNISIGEKVIIDDNCVLDAKGEDDDGIHLGDRIFISRNVIMGCKNGSIRLGSDISVAPNTIFHSVGECFIKVGDYCVIGAGCYFIGGPDYKMERNGVPMMRQGFGKGKGIRVGNDVWLGASVLMLDGTHIENGAVIGANSLVKGVIPEYGIAVGSPAIVKKFREG